MPFKPPPSLSGVVPVQNGGTGLDTVAAKSVLVTNAADTMSVLTPSAGQSIRRNAGDTAWEAYTPVASAGITVTEVTGTSQAAAVNSAYIANNAGLVTITLPDTAAVGDVVQVVGKGAGGWKIAQNASESIRILSATTTVGTGGSLASSNPNDCVTLRCVVANTTWAVVDVMSAGLTVV